MQLEASKFPLAIGPWTNWPRRATISAPFAAKSVSAVCAKKRRKIGERKSTCDTENMSNRVLRPLDALRSSPRKL